MKIAGLFLSILVIAALDSSLLAKTTFVKIGKAFDSPDKKFSVKIAQAGEDYNISIRDIQNEKSTSLPVIFGPILSLGWSSDSKTIVTVGHIAEGSTAEIIHFNKNSWNQSNVPPPEKGPCDYSVINWQNNGKLIHLLYKVAREKPNGEKMSFYSCSFDVDPETVSVTNVKDVPLSPDAYGALKSNF